MNFRQALNTYTFLVVTLLFAGCANIRSPQGGQKDDQPPVVLAAYPPPLSTNFTNDKIVFLFDEYVQLNNINTELVVSPPLQNKPKIKVRKKSVIIELNEELVPNTTYLFNFGDGIVDVNEQNKAQDLTYVFSTGDVIDSLSLSGIVTDVFADEPAKGFKVMAFDNDTSIFSKKSVPLYFAKTKEDGSFTLPYMREGDFFVYVLDDQNSNYRWDDGEAIALPDSAVNPANADSTLLLFNASIPRPEKVFISEYKMDSVGLVKFALDPYYKEIQATALNPDLETFLYRENDSVFVWLKGEPANKREPVHIAWMDKISDTLDVPFYKEALQKPFKLISPLQGKLKATEKITLSSKAAIRLEDSSKILLSQDSVVAEITFEYDSVSTRYHGSSSFLPGKNYELIVLPGAFLNALGETNDSLKYTFSIYRAEDLGNVLLDIKLPDNLQNGILTITDKGNNTVFEKADIKSGTISISSLPAGDYTVKILDDRNRNGLYDPVDLKTQTPPEIMRVMKSKISVRANWDIKTEWEVE